MKRLLLAMFAALLLSGCTPQPTISRSEQQQEACPNGTCPLKKPVHNPYSDI